MKKITTLLLSFLAIMAVVSCSDDDEQLFIDQADSQLTFESPASASYILTFETKDNLAERLVWSTPSFETPISVTYAVEASTDPNDFSNAEVVTTTNNNFVDLTVERLNDLSATLGLTPFSQGVIAMRIVGTTADAGMEPLVSDILTLSVTSYTTDSPKLYVPGNYAESSGYGANWTPSDSETPFLEATEFGSVEFEGFIFMSNDAPEFKFTPTNEGFEGAFGDGGTGMLSNDGGAGNLTVPGPGYYYITVNLDPDGDPTTDDASWSASSRVWGIIGAATQPTNPAGWDDELNMTYNKETKLWTVELTMDAGEFKFRAQEWTDFTNFGDNGGDGVLEFNSANIEVGTSGTYRAELDLSQPRNYTYELVSI
ncbi:SusE outer membrane protein [Nonlabens sp. Hel1_33_55]|uniref:SusE domain-containing protein n=1 Tax=Nonlabens sp. Hel1_33_55 TaxID=1336802 RepID=UPI000875D926|nr:SusE domain-containing protein [Nonlabens sp. Hel1_33_55]SCY42738.1 SusE outer membrane protein [Nonlabens sp. Hel1_33_55]